MSPDPSTQTTATAQPDANTPKNTKAAKVATVNRFGVYQLETGSYQFGETRFVPGVVTPYPASAELSEEDDVPVKSFATAELAQVNLAKLLKQLEAKKGQLAKQS